MGGYNSLETGKVAGERMNTTTIIIILAVLLVLGGGFGYSRRGRM
jgi:hypothetical protein